LRDPLRIFNITEGGLASHGGAVGILIALLIYCKIKNYNFIWLCDRMAYPTALVGCLIRLGNFFNSEIIGKPSDLPWAVVFERVDDIPRHPSMLYESLCYFIIFVILYKTYDKYRENLPRGLTTGMFFLLIFSVRIVLEFTKINQVPFEDDLPLNMGQLLSVPFVFVGAALIFQALKGKNSPAKP
jgi:prolipoprotein diacylglyceryl transferase